MARRSRRRRHGSIRQRASGSWVIIFDLGYVTDPVTGKRQRKQQTLTVHGTFEDAEQKLGEVTAQNRNQFVRPSKVPLLDYLRSWLKTMAAIKGKWRPTTVRLYKNVIETHIATQPIAFLPLEKIRSSDVETYLASLTDSAAASVAIHRAVLHRALKRATKDRLIPVNPAVDLDVRAVSPSRARDHCWSALEARLFLRPRSRRARRWPPTCCWRWTVGRAVASSMALAGSMSIWRTAASRSSGSW